MAGTRPEAYSRRWGKKAPCGLALRGGVEKVRGDMGSEVRGVPASETAGGISESIRKPRDTSRAGPDGTIRWLSGKAALDTCTHAAESDTERLGRGFSCACFPTIPRKVGLSLC